MSDSTDVSPFMAISATAWVLVDKDWTITRVNPAAEKAFGYSHNDLVGMKLVGLVETGDPISQLGPDLLLGSGDGSTTMGASMRNHYDGTFTASVTTTQLEGDNWGAAYALEIRDISKYQEALANQERLAVQQARKAMELQRANESIAELNKLLNRAADQLQAKVDERTAELNLKTKEAVDARKHAEEIRAVTDLNAQRVEALHREQNHFFQGVSHEIRTPLTLILNPLEHQARQLPNNRDIAVAVQNARRLLRLVNQLLDFQKIHAGKRELELQTVDALEFTRVCANYFSVACEDKNIQLSVLHNETPISLDEAVDETIFVHVEVDALEKILFNLLSNALKYTPYGGIIVLSLITTGKTARFVVQDSGPGISEEGQTKLFSLFSNVDDSQEAGYTGTGLGLALTKNLTESMRGHVGVESDLGHGSTFFAEFPRIEPPKPKLDLILVDHDPGIRKLIQSVMSSSDVVESIETASSAAQVRTLLESWDTRCILSDYILQGEDGMSLLQSIARETPRTKRAILTGYMLKDEVQGAMEAGWLHEVFYKPVDNDELRSTIENLVQQAASIQPDTPVDLNDLVIEDWFIPEAAQSPIPSEPTEDPATAIKGNGALILAIDDLPEMRTLLEVTLNRNGFRALVAANGLTALDLAEEYHPDVIISDWLMPKMTGPQLIRLIRSHDTLSNTPIILLTAKSDEESRLMSTEIGCDAFLSKPFHEPEMVSTLRNLLRLKEQEAEAINQSRYLRALFDSMPGGMLLLNPDGTIRDVNPHLAETLQCVPSEFIDTQFLELVDSEDVIQLSGLSALSASCEPFNVSFRGPGPESITMRIRSRVLRDDAGISTGFLLSAHDHQDIQEVMRKESVQLAEVHEIRASLEQKTAELENTLTLLTQQQSKLVQAEKLASLGSMVAGLAHQLNTPIGVSVTATSHMLPKALQLTQQLETNSLDKSTLISFIRDSRESLEIIESNLKRSSQLIQTFKQVSADTGNLVNRRTNLHSYCSEVLESMNTELSSFPHRVEVAPENPETSVLVEPLALAQVIKNLVINATHHAFDPSSDPGGTITLSIEPLDSIIELTVRDDGRGISEDQLSKIFDPFFTTSSSAEHHGLGLNIVYTLVTTRLGGSIRCQSEVGEGTQFVISLPTTASD